MGIIIYIINSSGVWVERREYNLAPWTKELNIALKTREA